MVGTPKSIWQKKLSLALVIQRAGLSIARVAVGLKLYLAIIRSLVSWRSR